MQVQDDGGNGASRSASREPTTELDSVLPFPNAHAPRVVGIGGSAGSIQALQRFFRAMPSDAGMIFVVVLHLSPDHESVLSEVLQRCTQMKVSEATDDLRILPNQVYVIPPGKQIWLSDDHLKLTALARDPRRATVDLFFRSLADSLGARAVGVVLSGGDGDGAMGIKRIKERGGLTIAQDPDAAEHDGMPRAAIATSMVDWVLRAEEMPARLVEYDQRERRLSIPSEVGPNPAEPDPTAPSNDEAALRDVLAFLRSRTGRDFACYKRATIVRRLARRMQVNEVENVPAYLHFLRTHPGEAGALLQDLLISVTNFFRDREAFAALEKAVPDLFNGKTQGDTVRVWVPACATGEEAYSVAMLLSEHARTLDAPPSLQVFATDLHEEALTEARRGCYHDTISADVSPERLQRYFSKDGNGYRVRRELREMVLFAVHDLLKDSPFSRLDLVSCRNILIYLNREAQLRALDVFHFALRPTGRLFLGTSESVDDASGLFFALDRKNRIYAPRSMARSSLPISSGPGTLARALAMQHSPEIPTHKPLPAAEGTALDTWRQNSEHIPWSELHLQLIERLAAPSLIVNDRHEILHLSQSASVFLNFGGGEPTRELLRVVNPGLRNDLRAALFRAAEERSSVAAEGVSIELAGEPRVVDVRVSPAFELSADFFLVELRLHPPGTAQLPRAQASDELAIQQLERELDKARRHLRDVMEEHQASLEEARASNEELQAMNEELRSASEELESSREELQSINEELTTVNQELKNTVEEVGHTNSDLQNLMGASAIATVFLDRELQIMRFTPTAVELFNMIPTDVGRPLADLHHRLQYPELISDAEQVLKQLAPVERQVSESSGRFFLARVLPYRTTDDRIAGIVLTLIDVTERELAQAAVQHARAELEQRVQERTAQLDAMNAQLQSEVVEHRRAEKARQELQVRLVNAQEEERGRISRELHDEIGQQISALMLSLKALEAAVPAGETPTKLRELRATAERVAEEIHQVAYELRPIVLDELGLERALGGFLETWKQRRGIEVDFFSGGIDEPRLPREVETTLYRITQEATNNVYKHAKARRVSVSIERRGDQVTGIIEDDGVGFDTNALTGADPRRIGIIGMRERVAIVGGELTIESAPGRGTTVRVRLPVSSRPD